MKTLPKFYATNTDTVDAYQKMDIEKMRPMFNEAKEIWYNEWVRLGATDEGSCCGGKGLQVWYAAPRKRSAEPRTIAFSPPCQGNVSASRSVAPAIEFLRDRGVMVEYYDGWMN